MDIVFAFHAATGLITVLCFPLPASKTTALQGHSLMLPEASQLGLTPQLASLLLNQNNPPRGPLEAWNAQPYKTPLEAAHFPDQPPMPSNHHLTQIEILQAISQIGVDNISPELLQQLRVSLGEGTGFGSFPPQQQIPGDLPLGSLPNMPDMSRLPLQDQAFRCNFDLQDRRVKCLCSLTVPE